METKKPVEVTVKDHVMQIHLNRPEDENRINREAMPSRPHVWLMTG